MITYNGITIGTLTIKQKHGDKWYKYNLEIRQGNCLAVLIHVRKATEEELAENPEAKFYHSLYTFFCDEQHLKNIMKDGGDILFGEKTTNISLNLYYKECNTLLKYLVRSGRRVSCYYKEPKKK